ncbi:MAG: Na+/H+ antiporter NhaC family protein [Lentisphaeria bacterium]|nr:Na+/H+ antiporter NhaC family protein [Lentisphaeria bacterium]
MDITNFSHVRAPRARALIPFGVFIVFYLGLSILSNDFYKVPMPVAFLIASATALLLNRRASLKSKIELFAHGMGNVDIMTMCLIFILAGAFASTAKAMGAVDATVQLALAVIPPNLLLTGLFVVACFISLAIGTSVGTIAALGSIAVGLSQSLHVPPGFCLGAVVGGAMFGDNLSMISDTTIAATRTQGVEMHRKFQANLKIAVPAAALTVLLYLCMSPAIRPELAVGGASWQRFAAMLPYISVLALALCGMNVMAVLILGTAFAGVIGMLTGSFDLWGFLGAIGSGTLSMSETLIVALLAGGLLKVIRYNGGIAYILQTIERHIRGRRGGELGTFLLVGVVNCFTANNTVAIVITGPIARDISKRYGIPAARTASILDSASCIIQGMLPYGAQILTAIGAASAVGLAVSPLEVIQYLGYPYLLGICLLISIVLDRKPGVTPATPARN